MKKIISGLILIGGLGVSSIGLGQNYTEKDLFNLAKNDVASYVKVMASAMQQQLPLETGSGKVINAIAVGKVLGFITEIGKSHRARTKQEQINYVCSASFLRAIIDNGGGYSVQYVTPERKLLEYVEVSPGDC